MEFIHSLGSAAFVSRVKGLSELMMKDLQRIYRELDTDFEPRWLLLFQFLLRTKAEMPVTVIARELNLTHPAVIQVLEKVEKKGLVKTMQDKKDHRRRLVCLTQKGKELALKISPIWDDIREAVDGLIDETSPMVMEILENLENRLVEKSLYSRVKDNLKFRMLGDIKLIEYEDEYYDTLQEIYLDYLKGQKLSVDVDVVAVKNIIDSIVNNAGKTYLMTYQGKLIGSFAIDMKNGKEAVIRFFCIQKKYADWGIDEKLYEKALSLALNNGVTTIYFFIHSNQGGLRKLMMARGFEESEGDFDFKHPEETYNVIMKLSISDQ